MRAQALPAAASDSKACARPCQAPAAAARRPAVRSCQQQRALACAAASRREGLLSAAGLLLLSGTAAARADDGVAAASQQYIDPQDNFSLLVPSGWEQASAMLDGNSSFTGASGARRTLAWFPEGHAADAVNVTLTITNTSAEFTGLGSFGNVYTFGQNLVNSMDRSFLLRARNYVPNEDEPIQVARLLDAADTRGMYSVEYTVEKRPGPKRHLYSLVALRNNGRYNRLYTLTAQCLEEEVGAAEPVLRQVLASFRPPAAVA